MKKFFSYTLYVSLLTIAFSFTACQDEFEEIGSQEETQAIAASSSTAKLIKDASSNDGSYDNIVDGTSCFDIKFPYTVAVNGLEVTLSSQEDLKLVEEIFDELEDDEDRLEIFFPVTITAGDFTEITINSVEDLRELAAECKEGGDDDDVECIDFVYPMTLFTLDINLEQTGTVIVESDRDLRLFFKDLGDSDLVSFDFPISLKKFDGTLITVENTAQLAAAIENAKDSCDEDDDDDYNDDDFDESFFDDDLTECLWLVKEIKRNNEDQMAQYVDYVLDFKENGVVLAGFRGGVVVEGTWSASLGDDGASLKMEFAEQEDLNVEWQLYELGDDSIKLYNGDANRIVIQKFCQEDTGQLNPDVLQGVLKECKWIIKDLRNQGMDIDRLLAYELEFKAERVLALNNGLTITNGTWEAKFNTALQVVLTINLFGEGDLSLEWPLDQIETDRLTFDMEEVDTALKLQRVCTNSEADTDVVDITNIMVEGEWAIASYQEGGMDMTESFGGYSIMFMADYQMSLREGGTSFANGLWRVIRDSEDQLKVFLNFGDNMPFDELTDDWQFVSKTDSRIELKHINGDNSVDVLVLEK